ncbi:hypothetical protein IAU60_000069 [Kwoniella sp. DSM 27419]
MSHPRSLSPVKAPMATPGRGPRFNELYAPALPTDDDMFKSRYLAIQELVYELEDENNLIAYKIAKIKLQRQAGAEAERKAAAERERQSRQTWEERQRDLALGMEADPAEEEEDLEPEQGQERTRIHPSAAQAEADGYGRARERAVDPAQQQTASAYHPEREHPVILERYPDHDPSFDQHDRGHATHAPFDPALDPRYTSQDPGTSGRRISQGSE